MDWGLVWDVLPTFALCELELEAAADKVNKVMEVFSHGCSTNADVSARLYR